VLDLSRRCFCAHRWLLASAIFRLGAAAIIDRFGNLLSELARQRIVKGLAVTICSLLVLDE
jgi:hypothetical protein